MHLPRLPVALVVAVLAQAGLGQPPKADWPQWRGPDGTGVSREKGWLTAFADKGPKTLWEAKVGRGHS